MKHSLHQSSLASGSRLVGTQTYIQKVTIAGFMTLMRTDNSWFLWPLLTLWEDWGLLTWSQRTWGPPRFGKCGKEASSEPAVEKGGIHILVTTATCKVTSSYEFSTKPFSWPGWQNQVVTLSHCTVSGMRRWGGGVWLWWGRKCLSPEWRQDKGKFTEVVKQSAGCTFKIGYFKPILFKIQLCCRKLLKITLNVTKWVCPKLPPLTYWTWEGWGSRLHRKSADSLSFFNLSQPCLPPIRLLSFIACLFTLVTGNDHCR